VGVLLLEYLYLMQDMKSHQETQIFKELDVINLWFLGSSTVLADNLPVYLDASGHPMQMRYITFGNLTSKTTLSVTISAIHQKS